MGLQKGGRWTCTYIKKHENNTNLRQTNILTEYGLPIKSDLIGRGKQRRSNNTKIDSPQKTIKNNNIITVVVIIIIMMMIVITIMVIIIIMMIAVVVIMIMITILLVVVMKIIVIITSS